VLFTVPVIGQTSFTQKTTSMGRLKLTMSNFGTIGRPTVRSNVQGDPSMSYPTKGKEHLFESGMWLGAIVNGQKLVSSGAVDASSGYATGASGYEFTPSGAPIIERSKLTSSPNYSSNAISHQDFVFYLTDANTIVPNTSIPINNHTNPLLAKVELQVYNWNYSYADFFVICNYKITNNSTNKWDSVYVGQWADLVVRDVIKTADNGTAFYNKGRNGVDDKYMAIYAWLGDSKADDANFIQSFGAMQFLGIDWQGMFFNPHQPDTFISRGFAKPTLNYNFWNFNSTSPPFITPVNDLERYLKLSSTIDSATLNGPSGPTNGAPNNWIQLISAGPIPSVAPGESFTYTMAYVAAKNSAYQISNNYVVANEAARAELTDHFKRTRSTYLGENVNEDGKYNSALDINGNGKLDQYILPEPPTSPKLKIIPSDNKVEIYWDSSSINSIDPISRKKDFEGFRIYRSNPGDDLDRDLTADNNLIAQWDSTGNSVGYNNGFEAIKLIEPKYFDGDPVAYQFKYTMDNLLNGWQYQFTVTAFDKGDELLNIPSLESSPVENEYRVFAGTTPKSITENNANEIGVYPNPFKISAAWDGTTSRTHKIYFTNLPSVCEINIYTSNGDLVASMKHDAATYKGEGSKWFENYSDASKTIMSGGEHAWDLLSNYKTNVSSGVYLFTVKDLKTGNISTGKFAILK